MTAWASLSPVIPVSHFQQPESGSEPKTLATSGRTSQEQLELFALDSASLKMSKDTSPSDSAKSLESWEQSVTRRRGEYSLRVKSGRLTSASGSSSWPTIRASEYKDVGPVGSKSHDHMLGKHYLCAVVTQEAANWPTPCAMEAEKAGLFDKGQMGQSLSAMANRGELSNWPTPDASNHRDGAVLRTDNNLEQGGFHGVSLHHAMTKYGLPAPANPSTIGSRQGLWPTATVGDSANAANKTASRLDLTSNHHSGTTLVDAMRQWATPNNFCFQPPENTEQWTKRAEYQQTEKGVNLHKPIQSQVLHENEKVMGAMPPSSAKLNPRWVETLMGLPIGWTMPSCKSPVTIALTNCDSSATESCQPPQSELF